MKKNLNTSILILSVAMALTACGGKSSSKSEPAPAEPAAAEPAPAAELAPAAQPAGSSATAGQKLIDLNKAREAGAISDDEYEAAKKRILEAQ